MYIYNVKHKGISIGLTTNKAEAMSWATGSHFSIHQIKYIPTTFHGKDY